MHQLHDLQLQDIALCDLVLGKNIRVNPGDREELLRLAESFLKQPIHPPIVGRDKLVLDGMRRVLGLRLKLGESSDRPVTCLVTNETLSDGQIAVINLLSAIHQKRLTGYEQWQGCERLLKDNPGWLQKDLAAALDLDPGMITMLVSPSKCIPAWQEALQAGRVTISHCYAASKVDAAQQHAMLATLLTSGATAKELNRQARKARNGLATTAVKVLRIRLNLPSGLTVTFAGKELSLDDAIEAASQAHKTMKKGQDQGLSAKTIQRVSAELAKT